jgi:hypothetical protein
VKSEEYGYGEYSLNKVLSLYGDATQDTILHSKVVAKLKGDVISQFIDSDLDITC